LEKKRAGNKGGSMPLRLCRLRGETAAGFMQRRRRGGWHNLYSDENITY